MEPQWGLRTLSECPAKFPFTTSARHPSPDEDAVEETQVNRNNIYSRRRARRKCEEGGEGSGGVEESGENRCRKSLGSKILNSSSSTLATASSSVSSSYAILVNVILIVLVNFICYSNCTTSSQSTPQIYSNHFAVHVPAGELTANEIAGRHGFVNTGQIGSLKDYYLFEHARIRKRSVDQSDEHHKLLTDEPDVLWFEQQVEKRRIKRDFQYYDGGHGSSGGSGSGGFFGSPSTHAYIPSYNGGNNGFPDPLWKEQWYLTGGSKDGFDMNVQAAWKRGFTGKGVTVSILDDGIQTNHPDLVLNYDPRASTDINDNDNDPYPQDNGDNKHGTRCAGEVAATAGNNICGVGVAYNASIGGVRMLDGTVNDAVEAKALGLNPDHVDIFSASWGPEDDGKTVDGPGPLARRAFIYGVTNGRRGLGSIFIWASGNGGRHVDSCNCDGYTNSIFTLSISSATQGGYKPWYLEECSSTLATTYSSGTPTLDKSVATVDMDGRLRPDHICTVEHTGTSASAPLAAGIAALALEANPNLSWRDLQHLVVLTSRPDPLEKEEGWYVNGVQRKFSHKFGYGMMDAGKMVDLAVDWAGVPPQHICKSREIREDREIPGNHLGKVKVFMDVDGCAGTNSEIRNLEHVQCKISLRFFPRGNLRILLTSPMGTTSVLLFERPRDVSSSNFDDWPFLSVHFWGEQAHGRWTLEIINSGSRRINQPGLLKKWQLILYGTDVNPIRLKSRSYQLPNRQGQFPTAALVGQQSHASYRTVNGDGTQLPPRFVPQEYLFGSASENHEQSTTTLQKKPHMVRSQCQNEYWIKDLAICVNDCPDGYYEEHTSRECLSCPQRCKSCYNSTSCTACEHNLVLFETACMAKCPDKYFEADSSCEPCSVQNCASCAGPMGAECVQCLPGSFLQDNQCVPKCSAGRRVNKNGECVQCHTGCASCDEGKCLQCYDGFAVAADGQTCHESNSPCPGGMFLDEHSGHCVACEDSNCWRCHSTGQCLECREGMIMKRGTCVAACGDGFYLGESGKECFRCSNLCLRCTSSDDCMECRTDAMLQHGKCLPHCSDGYYNDAGTCVTCSSACLTCIGPKDNECVTCGAGRRLTKLGTCALQANPLFQQEPQAILYANGSCSDGYFYDVNSADCRECHPSCARCSGSMAFQCRSCRYPLRLDRGSSRCIPCCHREDSQDCCHCDAKRHTSHLSSSPSTYNGECHFVSRRVSESEESQLSSGTLSDRVVLMSFWFTVFVLVLAVVVMFQRNKRSKRGEGNLSSSMNLFNSGSDTSALLVNNSNVNFSGSSSKNNIRNKWRTNSSSNVKYTPVNLSDDLSDTFRGDEDDEEDEIINMRNKRNFSNDDEDDVEFEQVLNARESEGVPLVLKT